MAVRGILLLAALLFAAATALTERTPKGHGHNHNYGDDHNSHGHHHGHNHGHEHDIPAVVPEKSSDLSNPAEVPILENEDEIPEIEPEIENSDESSNDEVTVGRMLYRQRRQAHGHDDGHYHGHDHGLGHGHGHNNHPVVIPEKPDELSNSGEVTVLENEGEILEVEPELENSEASYIPKEPSEENEDEGEENVANLKRQPNTEDKPNTELESSDVNQEISTSSKQGVQVVDCAFGSTPILSCFDCNTRLRCLWFGASVIPCESRLKPYCNNGVCSAVPGSSCGLSSDPRK